MWRSSRGGGTYLSLPLDEHICERLVLSELVPVWLWLWLWLGQWLGLRITLVLGERLCKCGQPHSGKMVECANPECKYGMLHKACATVAGAPRADWRCQACSTKRRREHD
jgi:hypothetical protein